LQASPIRQVICTDTIPLDGQKKFPKLTVLSSAPLLAEAIRRIHRDESVSSMFGEWT
ncbi:MAG: ribose-phosphate diphosphokinase, partial [Fimbriimonadales bacterium]|nr:ribose-phosphate diphosphokinase [Fimbriimonadales bacterium]